VRIEELDYDLPAELIAQAPLDERDGSRLLCLHRSSGSVEHARFRDLPERLAPSLLVLNDTRVFPARLLGRRATGGRAELLLLEPLGPGKEREQGWIAMARPIRAMRAGSGIDIEGGELQAVVQKRLENGRVEVLLRAGRAVQEAVEEQGLVPLPPYIRRAPNRLDSERYQTVYAEKPGAVAAPTAGLHFTEELLAELRARGHGIARITLHVGPGTFSPVRTDSLPEHHMHAERFEVPERTSEAITEARRQGRQVLAVGTTVVRALESMVEENGGVRPGSGSTSLFIYPPYRFRAVDALLTNFHLPRSTLLALVMAFAGVEPVRRAYFEAVASGYRFFSYGDAMLVQDSPGSRHLST
jgi:S-adenosylmethionine:tRNA ribosyltransferase-isomerase